MTDVVSTAESGLDAAKAVWAKRRERYADKLRTEHTLSGTPLKTVYTREDVDPAHDAEIHRSIRSRAGCIRTGTR